MLMTMMALELPRPVADLCADLAGQGFDVLDEREDQVGGNELVLQGPVRARKSWVEAFVRITMRDRLWSVDVRFEDMPVFWSARSWQAAVDGGRPETDLSQDARFIRFRLSEAAVTYLGLREA